jgi:diguanylate cyclase (GGDEF)-like protein/PAS domain S-box-containing protein
MGMINSVEKHQPVVPVSTLAPPHIKTYIDNQREQLFDALFENNPTAIAIHDLDGLIITCNPAFEKLFGYSLSEIQSKPLAALISNPHVYPEVKDNIQRSTHGEVIRTSGLRWRSDGKPVFVEIQGVPIKIGNQTTGVLMLYHDLTIFKDAEKNTQEIILSFERILNGIDSDIYVCDMKTYEILFVNQHMRTSFGENLVGKYCYQAFRGLDEPCNHCTNFQLLDSDGEPVHEPIVWEDQNPITLKWYQNSDCAIRWLDGRYVRLQIATDITEQKKAQEKLSHIAMHDALTGLPNRVLFFDRLEQALRFARRNTSNLAVFFIDLDKFKTINDQFGHHCGDLVLQETARRMRVCLRECDTLARNSGDEFTVLLEKMPDADVKTVAERIIQSMHNPMIIEGNSITLTVSMGISLYPKNGYDADSLVKHADSAMYLIKKNGGNGYGF